MMKIARFNLMIAKNRNYRYGDSDHYLQSIHKEAVEQ